MFRNKKGALRTTTMAALILNGFVLSGCATGNDPDQPSSIELQRSAMQRWNACLERNTHSQQQTAMQINQVLRHNCEGHKRDVIAVFPRHMSEQVDLLLVSSAYRILENNADSTELSPEQGELIQTLLR